MRTINKLAGRTEWRDPRRAALETVQLQELKTSIRKQEIAELELELANPIISDKAREIAKRELEMLNYKPKRGCSNENH